MKYFILCAAILFSSVCFGGEAIVKRTLILDSPFKKTIKVYKDNEKQLNRAAGMHILQETNEYVLVRIQVIEGSAQIKVKKTEEIDHDSKTAVCSTKFIDGDGEITDQYSSIKMRELKGKTVVEAEVYVQAPDLSNQAIKLGISSSMNRMSRTFKRLLR